MEFNDKNLIFIISQPRSGSTLLQAILAGFKQIDTISEHFMLLPFLSIYKRNLIDAKYDYGLATNAFWDFVEKVDSKEKFTEEYLGFIYSQYAKIQKEKTNYVLDKTPRYYEILDLITDLFPNAKVVILKRHPVAVFSSIMKTWDRYTFKELYKFHFRDLIHAPLLLQNFVDKNQDNSNVKVIKYEDCVTVPDKISKELKSWLNIEDDNNAHLKLNTNAIKGKYGDPNIHSKSEVSSKSSERWLQELKGSKVSDLLNGYGAFLGSDFLNKFGYPAPNKFTSNLKFKFFMLYAYNQFLFKKISVKQIIARQLIKIFYQKEIV